MATRGVVQVAPRRIPTQGFAKRYRAIVEIEREKAEQLNRVGARDGFISPAVLATDVRARVITFEKLDGLVPLKTHYLAFTTDRGPDERNERIPELFTEAGRALASLHRDLSMPERVGWRVPAAFGRYFHHRSGRSAREVLAGTPQAFLHGDFGFGNVHFMRGRGRLAVLDASPSHYVIAHPSNWASIYLDIGAFVACLRGLVGMRWVVQLRRDRMADLEAAFLRGYETIHGAPLDPAMTDAAAYGTAGALLELRYRLPALVELRLGLMFPDRIEGPGPTRVDYREALISLLRRSLLREPGIS